MVIGLSVRFEAGKAIKTLGRISTKLARGARMLSGFEMQQIKVLLAARTRRTYKIRSNDPSKWRDVSLPQAIWGRRKDFLGSRVGTLDLLLQQLKNRGQGRGGILPIRDTQKLFNSVSNANDRDFTFRIASRNAIVFGTKVGYAQKHLSGGTGLFTFGPREERRLKERVPPPGKTKRGGREVFGKKKGKTDRPYYVLRGWARKTYPLTGRIPVRSWLRPFNSSESARIGRVIEKALSNAILRAG